MSNTAYDPRIQPVDVNGDIYPGAKLNFYEVGGAVTRKDTYQDDGLTTAHTNPVVADANGRFAAIHLDGAYYVEMTDSADVSIWTMDNYNKGIADIIADLAASNASLFAQDTATTTGLTFGFQAGRVDKGNGTVTNVTAGTIALTDNTTNIVYLDYADDTVKTSTTAPGSNTAILFHVATSAGNITTVTEKASSFVTPTDRAFPPGHLDGLTVSLDSDADHDILISVGTARDAGDNQDISLTTQITKQIDVNWAEGDDAGGFPTGISLTSNTLYRVFVIATTGGTVDAGVDTSATASNLLSDASDYSYYRQVGWARTDDNSDLSLVDNVSPADSDRVLLDLVDLSTFTAAPSTVLFSDGITSTYRAHEFDCVGIVPTTDDRQLLLNVGSGSVDSGTNYDFLNNIFGTSQDSAGGTGQTGIGLAEATSATSSISNVAAEGGWRGTIRLDRLADAATTLVRANYGYATASGAGSPVNGLCDARHTTASAMDRVQFSLEGSDTFAEGVIRLYGLK